VFWNGVVLTAVEVAASTVSSSMWSYALNLELEEIVGAQVNAYRVIATGVKVRAVNFNCEFTWTENEMRSQTPTG
jgi:hypothetical protein